MVFLSNAICSQKSVSKILPLAYRVDWSKADKRPVKEDISTWTCGFAPRDFCSLPYFVLHRAHGSRAWFGSQVSTLLPIVGHKSTYAALENLLVVAKKWSVIWDINPRSPLKVNGQKAYPAVCYLSHVGFLLWIGGWVGTRDGEPLSPKIKRPGREADHSPSGDEVKESRTYTCTPPIRLLGAELIKRTDNITFTFILWPWRWRRYVPPKHRLTFSGLLGVICQKIELFKSSFCPKDPHTSSLCSA
jgi:hypothetical protein